MHSFLKSSLDELSTITSSNPDIHLLVEQAKDQLQTDVLDYESITTPFVLSFLAYKKVPDVILRNIKYFLETDKIKKDVYPRLLSCICERGYKDIKSLQIASLLAYKLNSSDLITLFKYVYGIKTHESDMICKQIILFVVEKYKKSLNEKNEEILEEETVFTIHSPKNECISLYNFILSLDDLDLIDLFLENTDFLDKKEIFSKIEKKIKNNLKYSLKLIGKLKLTNDIKALLLDNMTDYKLISKFFTNVALNKYDFSITDFKEELFFINEYILLGYNLSTKPKEKDLISNLDYFIEYYKDIKVNEIKYDNNLLNILSQQDTSSFPVIYSKILSDKNIILNLISILPLENELYTLYIISLLKLSQKEGINLLNNKILSKVIDFIYDYDYLKERSLEMEESLLINLLTLLSNIPLVKEIYLMNIKRLIYSKFNIFTKLNYLDSELIKEYFLQCKDVSKEIELLPFIYLRTLIGKNTYDLVIVLEVILRYNIYYKYIYKEILLIFTEIIHYNTIHDINTIDNNHNLNNSNHNNISSNNSKKESILYIIINAMIYFINELIIYTDLVNETLEILKLLHDITLFKELGNYLLKNKTNYQEKYLLLLLEEKEYFLEIVFWFIKKSNNPFKSVLVRLINLENINVISFVNEYLNDKEVIECYLNKVYEYFVSKGNDSEIGMMYLEGLRKILNNSLYCNDTFLSNVVVKRKISKKKNKHSKNIHSENNTTLHDCNTNTINNTNTLHDGTTFNDNNITTFSDNITTIHDSNKSINTSIIKSINTSITKSIDSKFNLIINNLKLSFNPSFYNTLLLLLNKNNISFINKLINNNIPLDITLLNKVLSNLICKECVCMNYEESILLSLNLSKENDLFINLVKNNIKEVNDDLFDKINTSLLCLLFSEEKSDKQSLILDILILLINTNISKTKSIKSITNKIYKNISDEYLLVKYFNNLNEEYLEIFVKIIKERIKERKEVLLITLSFDKIYLYDKQLVKEVSSLIINDYIKKYKIYDRLIDKKDTFITKHVLLTVKDKEVLISLKEELFMLMRNKCFLSELEGIFYIMMN